MRSQEIFKGSGAPFCLAMPWGFPPFCHKETFFGLPWIFFSQPNREILDVPKVVGTKTLRDFRVKNQNKNDGGNSSDHFPRGRHPLKEVCDPHMVVGLLLRCHNHEFQEKKTSNLPLCTPQNSIYCYWMEMEMGCFTHFFLIVRNPPTERTTEIIRGCFGYQVDPLVETVDSTWDLLQ